MRREVSSGSQTLTVCGDELADLVPVLLDDPEHRADDPVVQLRQQRLVLDHGLRPAPSGPRSSPPGAPCSAASTWRSSTFFTSRQSDSVSCSLVGMVEHLLLDRAPRGRSPRATRAAARSSSRSSSSSCRRSGCSGVGAHAGQRPADAVHHLARAPGRPRSPAPTRGSPRGSARGSAPRSRLDQPGHAVDERGRAAAGAGR